MESYDVAVAYRVYPGLSRGTLPVFKDKRTLVEQCARSFHGSLGTMRARVWAILDNCPAEYEDLFRDIFGPSHLEIVRCPGVGNAATFDLQRKILGNQSASDIVYVAEDDYLYQKGQLAAALQFLRSNPDVDFVTPYDHPDEYSRSVSMSDASVRVSGGLHWRTVTSTCLTFATRRPTLRGSEAVFATYGRRNYDASIWHSLTKSGIRRWVTHPRAVTEDRLSRMIIAKTFLFGWKQIAFGKRYTLWAPIPSIATHCQQGGLAPNVEWFRKERE